MTKRKATTGLIDVKELLQRDEDFLRAALQPLAQAALEAEMTETIGAAKGERSEARLAYRSGYYSRALITGSAPSNCGSRRIATGGFRPSCSSATSARRRRWWARWPRCTCRVCRPAKSRR
jgi:transposase-like protein